MALETPNFQAYRGDDAPRFVNEAELEYAKILDYHGMPWLYEPHTFVLERDDEGRVTEAFTPDFYLPEQDLYLEVTVMKQSLVTRKNRKLRKLRELYPEVRVKLFYERDFERLAARYGLASEADAERRRRDAHRRGLPGRGGDRGAGARARAPSSPATTPAASRCSSAR